MSSSPISRAFAVAISSAAALPLSSCVTVSESNPKPPLRPAAREKLPTPKLVAVSPLTRIGIDPAGLPAIFLHLEFRDSGGTSTKALGQVRVELFQSGAPAPASSSAATAPAVPAPSATTPPQPSQPQTLASTWDADLRDPIRNTLSFDELITRTYTINLSGIPEWLVHWARHEGPAADAPAPTLVVQFIPADATSMEHAIRTTYTLTR